MLKSSLVQRLLMSFFVSVLTFSFLAESASAYSNISTAGGISSGSLLSITNLIVSDSSSLANATATNLGIAGGTIQMNSGVNGAINLCAINGTNCLRIFNDTTTLRVGGPSGLGFAVNDSGTFFISSIFANSNGG